MSLGGWIGLAAAGGVSVLLAITILVLISYAKARSARADEQTDRAEAEAEKRLELARENDTLKRDKVVLEDNNQNLTTALESAKVEIPKLRATINRAEENLHAAITNLGKDAPTAAVKAAIKSEAEALRAELDRLTGRVSASPAPQAMPQAGAAPAAAGAGGGEAGQLHDPADVRDPRP